MGGEAALPTNPERDALERASQIIQTVQETRRPGRRNEMHEFPQMDITWVYKIKNEIELSTNRKISIPRVNKFNDITAPQYSYVSERHVD